MMMKHIGIAAVALVLTTPALAQTIVLPPSDSSTINTQRQDQPVLPGQSTVPSEYPNGAQKSLDTQSGR